MYIRACYEHDLDAVMKIEGEANVVYDEDFETETQRPQSLTREAFRATLLKENVRAHVVCDGKEVIGYRLFEYGGDAITVKRLAMKKSRRRQGGGGILLADMLKRANERIRTKQLCAIVPDYDRESQEFYKAAGFRAKLLRNHYGKFEDAIEFVKMLASPKGESHVEASCSA